MSDPAFMMYAKDWLTGTGEMSLSEKGVYIDLLCYQHQNNGLPASPEKIARIVGLGIAEFSTIWSEIKDKFPEGENGRLYNTRLVKEVERRKEFSRKKTILGIFGAAIKKMTAPQQIIDKIKKEFDFHAFTETNQEILKEAIQAKLQAMLQAQLEHIGTGTGDATGTGTGNATTIRKGGTGEKQKQPHQGVIEVIQYLNELNGTNFRTDTKATVKLIEQRFAEGFPVSELKEIIEYKVAEWKGTTQDKWLQPDTLFNGENCAKYRNQVQAAKDKKMSITQIRSKPSNAPKTRDEMMEEFRAAQAKKYATQ